MGATEGKTMDAAISDLIEHDDSDDASLFLNNLPTLHITKTDLNAENEYTQGAGELDYPGNIKIAGGLGIVKFASLRTAGGLYAVSGTGIFATSEISAGRSLRVSMGIESCESIEAGDDILAGCNIYASRGVSAGGDIHVGGDIIACDNIAARYHISADGDIRAGLIIVASQGISAGKTVSAGSEIRAEIHAAALVSESVRLLVDTELLDAVYAIHQRLWHNDSYRALLAAATNGEAVEGSLICDDVAAAHMVRNYGKARRNVCVAKQPLAAVIVALRLILQRYQLGRTQRRAARSEGVRPTLLQ
jgi:hypothetical protein